MKAITIWQPWAEFIAAGVKHNETRSWATKYRGPIAIHAAVKPIRLITEEYLSTLPDTEKALGDYSLGRYAWELRNIKELPEPIKAKDQQGLWNWEA